LGHKVHPIGFRLGITKSWQSKWYSDTHYAEYAQEDTKLRDAIVTKYREAAISLVEIDRQTKDVAITLHTARPGIVIGRGGQRVDEMRLYLEGLIGKRIRLNIQEIRQPEMDAYLVARSIAEQMERRIAYRRAMKQAIFRTIQAGAKGIKIVCSGRLGGAEIARRQTLHQGQVPLHTLRADLDYGFTESATTMGRIGVKVWIYKGQVVPEAKEAQAEKKPAEAAAQGAEPTTGIDIKALVEAAASAAAEKKTAEAAAEAPAAPRQKKSVKAAASKEVAAETSVTEKKEAKPRVRKATKAVAEEEPKAKPEAKPAKAEEKPAKPAVKRVRKSNASKAKADDTVTKEEE
jgi:small subunit ribosomal protein S3